MSRKLHLYQNLSHTLVGCRDSNAILIGDNLRYFSLIEKERLQGFSDNWTVGFSKTARNRMIGNAVTVPVAKWIGKRIVEVNLAN